MREPEHAALVARLLEGQAFTDVAEAVERVVGQQLHVLRDVHGASARVRFRGLGRA
jgi:hypothetical protein